MMSHDASVDSPAATTTFVALLTTVTIIMTTVTTTAQDAASDQPDQVEWDLSEIYPTLEAWETARGELATRVEALAAYRGRLGQSAATLREAFDAISATEKELSRLYVFAFLKADEDRRVSEDQERRGLAAALLSEFGEAVAFLSPELLSVGSETVQGYLAEEPGL
ncbi:MAG TPA: oligoendopeptidase F, partial [Acidobacteria bacterium]|nr:oligoendopeptidase F [Acidobacteriota bacterium]